MPKIEKINYSKGVSMGATQEAVKKHFTQDQIKEIIDSIRMRVQSCASLRKFEPYDFIRETKVKFITCDDLGHDVEIGEASLFFVNGNLAHYTYNCALFHVFDACSQDLCDIYQAFFKKAEWIDQVRNCEIFTYDALYLDYICLNPEYRGYGIGRILAMGLIEEFGKEGEIVIAWPIPVELQENEGIRVVEFQPEKKAATRKLVRMCESLGFIRLSQSNMLFLPRTEQYPSVAQILKKMFPANRNTSAA